MKKNQIKGETKTEIPNRLFILDVTCVAKNCYRCETEEIPH